MPKPIGLRILRRDGINDRAIERSGRPDADHRHGVGALGAVMAIFGFVGPRRPGLA